MESRSRIGNQFFYALVVLQLAISIGGLLGTNSMRISESTALVQRAALTSYRSQLDRLQTQMGGAQDGESGPEILRGRAATLASSLRKLGETTPAGFDRNWSMTARQADAFRQLSARPIVDTRWIADYDRQLDETAHSLDHERAMTNAAETEFLGQAQKITGAGCG
jgi:hypothetical protein